MKGGEKDQQQQQLQLHGGGVGDAKLEEYMRLKALATDKFKEKKYEEAVKYYDEAAYVIYNPTPTKKKGGGCMDPTRLGYYVVCKSNAAQCYINFGDFKGAIKYASEALSKDPKNVKALYRRGVSRLRLNIIAEAMDDLKLSLELDPGNEGIENELKRAANLYLLLVTKSMELNAKKLKGLLKLGADINFNQSHDGCGFCALIIASLNGYMNIIELLLAYGALIDNLAITGFTALMAASDNGHLNIVELFLSKGANVNGKDNNGNSALFRAAEKGKYDVAKLLLSSGANINDKNGIGYCPLYNAAGNGHIKVVELLLTKGAIISDKNDLGFSALMFASEAGHLNVIELLLSKGANINDKAHSDGSTALMLASKKQQVRAAELLMSKGANVNINSTDNWSPLMIWSYYGNTKTIELMLSKGARINDKATTGFSALFVASQEGHINAVKLLLSYGASNGILHGGTTCVNVANSNGVTIILKKWDVTMLMIVLEELCVLSGIDPSSFIDLRKYID